MHRGSQQHRTMQNLLSPILLAKGTCDRGRSSSSSVASDFRARSSVRLCRDHRCAHCAESRLLLSVSQDLPWSLDSEEEQRICDYQLYDAGKDPKKM
jgi:hypothetical protein